MGGSALGEGAAARAGGAAPGRRTTCASSGSASAPRGPGPPLGTPTSSGLLTPGETGGRRPGWIRWGLLPLPVAVLGWLASHPPVRLVPSRLGPHPMTDFPTPTCSGGAPRTRAPGRDHRGSRPPRGPARRGGGALARGGGGPAALRGALGRAARPARRPRRGRRAPPRLGPLPGLRLRRAGDRTRCGASDTLLAPWPGRCGAWMPPSFVDEMLQRLRTRVLVAEAGSRRASSSTPAAARSRTGSGPERSAWPSTPAATPAGAPSRSPTSRSSRPPPPPEI